MSIRKCQLCNKETKNPKFCSSSCSATFNNKINPKRKPESKCIDCGKAITTSRTRCREHYLMWAKNKEAKDMTLQEAIYWKHHKSSAFALVRSRVIKIILMTNRRMPTNSDAWVVNIKSPVIIARQNPVIDCGTAKRERLAKSISFVSPRTRKSIKTTLPKSRPIPQRWRVSTVG